jgi:hydrogenase/urease accessory protein HupE
MFRSTARLLLAAMLWWLAAAREAAAHQADSSFLRLRLQSGVLEVRVTFDAGTLQKIAPTLDGNGDGSLSKAELAEATPMIQQFIEANVAVELDGKDGGLGIGKEPFWPLDAPDPLPDAMWHDQSGLILFPFDLGLAKAPRSIGVVFDGFPVFGDRHRVFAVLEEGGKSQPVILSATQPKHVFTLATAPGSAPEAIAENVPAPQPSPKWQFFWEGVKHILEGYDHLAFLIALVTAATMLRQVVVIVTAFTVAHSITLILAARGLVHLPARAVECAIAATIVYVAVENVTRQTPRHRWALTFVFGLIHGFGFANVLRELTLPQDAMVTSLLLFNVGVEAGQLAILAIVWPLLQALGRAGWGKVVRLGVNGIAAVLGLAWLVDRLFTLRWMPF